MAVTSKVCLKQTCTCCNPAKPAMYKVVWSYDGCISNDASIPLVTMADCKDLIRHFQNKYASDLQDPKLGLEILDMESGRVMSYVL